MRWTCTTARCWRPPPRRKRRDESHRGASFLAASSNAAAAAGAGRRRPMAGRCAANADPADRVRVRPRAKKARLNFYSFLLKCAQLIIVIPTMTFAAEERGRRVRAARFNSAVSFPPTLSSSYPHPPTPTPPQ